MLATSRQGVTEQSPWSISKFGTPYPKTADSLRMSSFDAVTQSDWQGQYAFLPPGDNNLYSQSYEHVSGSTDIANPQAQPRSVVGSGNPLEIEPLKRVTSPLGHRADPLGLRQPKQSSPVAEQVESHSEPYAQKATGTAHEESYTPTKTPNISLGSHPLSSVSSAAHGPSSSTAQSVNEAQSTIKEEDDDVLDDEEMIDGDVEGEPQAQAQPQTAAERTAQRRKMKRFRLTHQQTRFLMSEFAKQPHPDAAHRERLSREIPGLSPRQVQVWFQNRRAKIKRLTADERDRVMKMRAVPDDFDNVQALHAPYGAVHGLGTPLTSPADLAASSYADHMMRSLMVDVRRSGTDDHLSPTGLSPAFGSIGFHPSNSLNNPDILSPMSPPSTDRYGYSNHLSGPLSAGSRSSNPFARQPGLDTSVHMHNHHSRHQIRPLQPLQLRETMNRSRADTLQSPLRTSMSWKGDSLDYTTYHGSNTSPPMDSRPQSLYHQDHMNSTSTAGLGSYDSTHYAGSTVQSPAHLSYPNYQSSSLQNNSQRNSRLRASSASLPLGLDLRTQFRSAAGANSLQSAAHSPTSTRTPSTSQLGSGGVSSSYSASSFPSAPLSAPVDYSLPRTSPYRPPPPTGATDYCIPQMSAPIAPPNNFSQAFQASMSSGGGSSRSTQPLRDNFGGSALGLGHGHHNSASHSTTDDYSAHAPLGMKRKRSYSGTTPAVSSAQGSGAYGAAV
ncbi:hypothetical protein QBC32DRAFT_219124 [Pseudoneurospora amorphoporcata]|uniref:Homeobox domain-containing protein n=1 Tax=Pseudoneurospora amorphoporcata TaxID=241081 RepID=A0AAN6NRG1_9PEZI|nr:hypothetical protein QBC32DRAFT_219124 [Pseudoneurospora amorphoporcata]